MSSFLVRGVLAAAALFFLSELPAAAQVVEGEEHCVVNVRSDDRLNMREGPSASAPITAQKRYGDCGILVNQCSGNWCKVEDGHSLGWVHRRYISMVSPARYCVTGVAQGDRLNVRAFPSPQSRVLVRLQRNKCGISFLPYATKGWQKIRVDGWQGWVNANYLSGQ